MAQTHRGGKKTAKKLLAKHPHFYATIGRKGGRSTARKYFGKKW